MNRLISRDIGSAGSLSQTIVTSLDLPTREGQKIGRY